MMLSLFLFFLATSEASQLPGYGGSVPGGYGGGGAYGGGGQYGGAYGGGPAYGGGSTYGGGGPYGGGKGYGGGGFGLGAVGGYPGGGYPGGFPGGAKGGIYQTGGAAFGPGGAYGVAGGYGPYATGGGNPLLAEALYGNRHNYVAGGNLNLGHGGIKSPLNVITQAAYQNNFAPLQNYGYGGFGGLQPYGADEINKFRHKKGLHALDEDDLDADGKPDHLVATKYKIDDYLAKQWHLGRRKLTVNVQSSTVPLEYQYLQRYLLANPVTHQTRILTIILIDKCLPHNILTNSRMCKIQKKNMEAIPNMAVPSSPTMVGVVALINRSHNSTVRSMVVVISSMVVISIGMLDHLSNTTSHLSSTTSHLISHNTNQSTKMRLITTHHPHHLITTHHP